MRYRGRGLLLDSNLLLLYLVGIHDRRLIRSFKRTRQFEWEDFRLLVGVMDQFTRLLTTPHVLTEVNGLSNQLPDRIQQPFRSTLAERVRAFEEHHLPASALVDTMLFPRLGLTDAGLAHLAGIDFLVLSVDLPLVLSLQQAGQGAVNFNHLRFYA